MMMGMNLIDSLIISYYLSFQHNNNVSFGLQSLQCQQFHNDGLCIQLKGLLQMNNSVFLVPKHPMSSNYIPKFSQFTMISFKTTVFKHAKISKLLESLPKFLQQMQLLTKMNNQYVSQNSQLALFVQQNHISTMG